MNLTKLSEQSQTEKKIPVISSPYKSSKIEKTNLWCQDSAHILLGWEGLVNKKEQKIFRGGSKLLFLDLDSVCVFIL